MRRSTRPIFTTTPQPSRRRRLDRIILAMLCWSATSAAIAAEATDDAQHVRWAEFREAALPAGAEGSPWYDLILPVEVFGRAREDLGDLRLFDAAGSEVHYALRVREAQYSQQEVKASEFNRSTVADETSELTLDLGENPDEHNEVELKLPGEDFRRQTVLEASDDGKEWHKLVERNLFHFRSGAHELHESRLSYPPSRFRYLRVQVERDATVDRKPVEIEAAIVRRRVELPGEFVTIQATVGSRDAVRAAGAPGSAWIIDLGVDHVPCERIELEIAETEFARDYVIEAGGPVGSDQPFVQVAWGQWSRKAGEASRPATAVFPEQRCARLRLVVTDYSNPPLSVQGCRVQGAARELVFAHENSLSSPLKLYYGNPNAEPPHYDLERNLPAQLEPKPERIELGPEQSNPDYVPEPLPFTERWPWLIDLVLAAAGLALAAIIVSLGRTAIANDDAREQAEQVVL
jgi:uncharacterized protein DUF3999